MPRVKTGTVRRAAHKKIFAANKGYRMSKRKLFKVAKEAYLHAGQYAYVGRRLKKRDFRSLWIVRLSAAAQANGMSYSRLIDSLKKAQISLNRKMLSEIAIHNPKGFSELVNSVK